MSKEITLDEKALDELVRLVSVKPNSKMFKDLLKSKQKRVEALVEDFYGNIIKKKKKTIKK